MIAAIGEEASTFVVMGNTVVLTYDKLLIERICRNEERFICVMSVKAGKCLQHNGCHLNVVKVWMQNEGKIVVS